MQFFHWDELNFSFSRRGRQRLQVEFLIAGDDRHNNSIVVLAAAFAAVWARDQRLENLLRRQTDLGGNCFRGEVVGIYIVLAQFVADSQPIEQARGVSFLSRFHVV